MSEGVLTEVARALRLAIFQRDENGCFRLEGRAPDWLALLWPQGIGADGVLRPQNSPFLDNFLTDAEVCWQTRGDCRASSGLWIEKDARDAEYRLQAGALTVAGRATLVIEELGLAYEGRRSILQKAHEAALAYEKLERAEQALAEEKGRLEQQYRRQAALAEIELAINQPHELQRVLDRVAEVVTHLLPATAASVVLWDAAAKQFVVGASTVPSQPAQLTRERVRPREGATRWIVEHKRPCIVPDVRQDSFGANSMLDEFGLRAYAGFPLLVEGEVLGVVYALDAHPRNYAPAELDFISSVASRAAVAISKVRFAEHLQTANRRLELQAADLSVKNHQLNHVREQLEQRVQERTAELAQANAALQEEVFSRRHYAERLEGMRELDKAILAAQSPEAIAEAVLRRLHHLLPCDQASVVELDPDHECATVLAALHRGEMAPTSGWQLSGEQLRKARVLQSGRPYRVTGAPNIFEAPEAGGAGGARAWPLILDLPMIAEGTLIGVLNLATASPAEFSPEREEIALEVAAQLAVALRQARLFAQVSAGREQLRALSLRLVEVQEAERRFIARELHDEIGQALTGLKLTLEMSRRQAVKAPNSGLWEALHMLDELMQRVRQLSLDLRPQMLDDLGLLPALDWLFQRYFKQTGIRVQFRHTPLHDRLPAQFETAVFRIVQEALTNVARHAGVAEVTVRLWADGHHLGVQVEDQGVGFDAVRALVARASTGLSGMKERAKLLGGEFTLDSSPGSGARLTVELPLDASHATPASPSETSA